MILTLIGLVLNFLGSIILVCDTLINFGKIRTFTYTTNPWGDERVEVVKSIKTKQGYEDIKGRGAEEKILILSLTFICLGFFLQLLEFLSKI